MDPAVGVEDILGNVFGVNTINGVTNILSRGHYQRECQQKCHCCSVVETKYAGVDGHVMRFHQSLETTKYLQHDDEECHSLANGWIKFEHFTCYMRKRDSFNEINNQILQDLLLFLKFERITFSLYKHKQDSPQENREAWKT